MRDYISKPAPVRKSGAKEILMAEFKNRPDTAGRLKPAPQGMILVVTIVALLLIALMGAAIMLNTSVEMNTASNTVTGRDAFTRADSSMQVAALLTTAVQHPELGVPLDWLNNDQSRYAIGADDLGSSFNYTDLVTGLDRSSINQRYIRAGRANEGDADEQPDLTFRDATTKAIVATSVISRDFDFLSGGESSAFSAGFMAGTSVGTSEANNTGGGSQKVENFLITSAGRTPSTKSADFFGSDKKPDEESAEDKAKEEVFGPNSIITVVYRTVIILPN